MYLSQGQNSQGVKFAGYYSNVNARNSTACIQKPATTRYAAVASFREYSSERCGLKLFYDCTCGWTLQARYFHCRSLTPAPSPPKCMRTSVQITATMSDPSVCHHKKIVAMPNPYRLNRKHQKLPEMTRQAGNTTVANAPQAHSSRGRGNTSYQRRDAGVNFCNQDKQTLRKGGYFGFKPLQELLAKQPEEALSIFAANIERIFNYINSKEAKADVIVLIFEVLDVIVKATYQDSVAKLLLYIVNAKLFDIVKNYIVLLPLDDSAKKDKGRRFWNAPDQFFLNVARSFDVMLEVMPATAIDIVPDMIKTIVYTLPNIEREHRIQFCNDIGAAYEDLQLKVMLLMEKDKQKNEERKIVLHNEEEPPPNDFRDIDVYPTILEVTTRTPPYLRKNVVQGAYVDVYHYLDVQFRLLREDFIAPLRQGICEHFDQIKDGRKERLSNINIFRGVLCLDVVPNANQVGYLVQVFKPKTIRNIQNTKRFMFGSLVCLTSDNFTSIIFGKIIDRDLKYITGGQIVLGFDIGIELEINRTYTMVECKIYFEPYYQVLTALKQMDIHRLPFKEYLVDVRTDAEVPDYRDLMERLDVEDLRKELNSSQVNAYCAAMMSKFCIVQGPPGTGKTYVALKIAKDLLRQKELWKTAPMLVICYTNHALDQFLEGLLEQTFSLVRVGGQSKSERLRSLNLRNLPVKNIPAHYFKGQKMAKDDVECCSRQVSRLFGILKAIQEMSSIMSFSAFQDYDVDCALTGSWFSKASEVDLLRWLLYQPGNRGEVKFSDYGQITQTMLDTEGQEAQHNEGMEVDEGDEGNDDDNPFYGRRAQNQLDIDHDEDLKIRYEITDQELFNVHKTRKEIKKMQRDLEKMVASGLEHSLEYTTCMHRVIKLKIDCDYVCKQLRMLKNQTEDSNVQVYYEDPKQMAANDRWLLYGNWLRRYRGFIMAEYVLADKAYRQSYRQFIEVKDMLDLYRMKHVDVVGMTTTGAARLHKTLQALGCPIVIVEEAAEVLEAHIVTALSPNCKHLILIGDHKQLKPSTADFNITKHYNFGVSLFERMVCNGLHCHTLDVQHRMRPEIANLVCPVIYPVLHNHPSVLLHPNVRGVDSPLYFITHENRERESPDKSRENYFEADFLIQLARYLVLNNCNASRITLIAAYSGQWFVLRKLRSKYAILQEMRICILDNFQGEENDIILLTLVRNNEDGKNGFLNLENRICVALSRAKHGMYIMGNLPQLSAGSKIWQKVSEVLEKYNAVGSYLTVRCVNHPDIVTQLREPIDFQKVPEGGCLKICAKPLVCGHKCPKLCHSTSHDNYKCHQPCLKVLCEFGHYCPDKCFNACDKCMVPKFATLACGHSRNIPCHQSPEEVICIEKVSTLLPCQHIAYKPCYEDPERFKCPHPCDARVEPCGHQCSMRCHIRKDPNHEKYNCLKQCVRSNKSCQMPEEFKHACQKRCFEECQLCEVEIKKKRSCQHYHNVACHANVEDLDCERRCKRKMACGHNCINKCNSPCGPCKVKICKTICCGHCIDWGCGMVVTKSDCKSKVCTTILACGHSCPAFCREDCSTVKCMELVQSSITCPCGHVLTVPCHLRDETIISDQLLSYCSAKCRQTLECGHMCSGTCGKCAQGRFHAACTQACDKTLICGHGCSTPCVENCKPCIRNCDYRCEHSKCTRLCGVPCTNCAERCSRRCAHQTCSKKCGEICDVPPCDKPCPKILKCGHPCIGFCGDVCPPLCRVCNFCEVTEVFFGTEDEEGAIFVYLESCKHTLESSGLDHWFGFQETEKSVSEVNVLRCPKCKAILQAPRYRDEIKRANINVQMIKQRYFGQPQEIRDLTIVLHAALRDARIKFNSSICKPVMKYFENTLKVSGKDNRRQDNSKACLDSIRARFELFMSFVKIRYGENGYTSNPINSNIPFVDHYLCFIFEKLTIMPVSINNQQIQEFQMEIMRYNRIQELAKAITINPRCVEFKEYHICNSQIFTFTKYDELQDDDVKIKMQALHRAAYTGLTITQAEKREIVGALRMGPGHWYKCARGHVYLITECGGANQLATCPECGLFIGGTDHQLTEGNMRATEMEI